MFLAGVAGAYVGAITIAAPKIVTIGATVETIYQACGGDCSDEIKTGTNTVYRVMEQGKTIYVGITNSINQRATY
jgi:hypothetical protein